MRPTRTGLQVLGAAAVLGPVGAAAGYPELVLFAAAAAAALAAALVWTLRSRARLAVRRGFAPAQPCAGDTVTVTLRVENPERRTSRALVAVERAGGRAHAVPIPALGPGQGCSLGYEVPAVRRGRLRVSRPRIGRDDPLGLLGTTAIAGGEDEIRVHPAWHPVGPLRAEDAEPGLADALLPRGEVAFHALREYRPGDPLRLIHWRATARRGGAPVVRQSADPREPLQVLVLDTAGQTLDPEAFEQAVGIAASLAVAACREGLALELHCTGGVEPLRLPAARPGLDHGAVLDLLSDVEQGTGVPGLAELLDLLLDTLADRRLGRAQGAVLGVVSGRLTAAAAAALTRAAEVCEAVYAVHVGAGPAPLRADRVLHVEAATSRQFALEHGSPAWP